MSILEHHIENLLGLLELEREAEKEENRRGLERYPLQVRESLGKTVTKLQIVGDDIGVGGLPLLLLSKTSPDGQLSPFHAMNQGDNVLVTFTDKSGLKPIEGTLYAVTDVQVTVALASELPDPLPPGPCQLDMLGSDATYKRMRQALGMVKRSEKPDLVRLRNVLLGEKAPSADRVKAIDLFNENLNEFQVEAAKKCLASEDVAIIHGPPGTGKTTVLVEVILQSIENGAKVLASAPSNIAVDNIVEKLLSSDIRVVRLGHPARILESLRHVTLDALEMEHPLQQKIKEANDERHRLLTQYRRKQDRGGGMEAEERRAMIDVMEHLRKQANDDEFAIRRSILEEADVILATHAGMSGLLSKHKFDLLVMDEASQATEPLSWVPITFAKKVIFAGDTHQLPPTVYSKEAAEKGLSTTMFDRLKKILPENLQTLLRVQYRMHEQIMGFSSEQFYEGKLIAHESVKDHTADELPGVEKNELTSKPIVFIDTAGTGYGEAWNELLESRENEGEANLVFRLYEEIRAAGIAIPDIAIITPYVAQVKRLRLQCPEKGVEIGSVDSFQGREKEVVILSLVRSNDQGEVGFLGDTRRMNVAMTRARRLLIVIGDSATIGQNEFYGKFLDYVDKLDAHGSAWEWINR